MENEYEKKGVVGKNLDCDDSVSHPWWGNEVDLNEINEILNETMAVMTDYLASDGS